MTDQCQTENYTNLLTSILAVGVLVISEVLPFIKSLNGNGLVHGIVNSLVKKFPVNQSNSQQVALPIP